MRIKVFYKVYDGIVSIFIEGEKVLFREISTLALVLPEILLVGVLLELSRHTHLLPPDQPKSFQADPSPELCKLNVIFHEVLWIVD